MDWVVVTSIDRLTRRLFDLQKLLATLEEYSVRLGVVCDPQFDQTAANRLMTNIVAAAAEFQQDMTRERLAESRTVLKSRGRRVAGRVPYGYVAHRESKQLVVSQVEADRVRRLFDLAAKGRRPQEIADLANAEAWPARSSRRWTARQVLKML